MYENYYREPAYRCLEHKPNEFKTFSHITNRGLYREMEAEILSRLDRRWNRHPELRAEFGNDYQRYIRHMKHEYTFG